MVTREGRERRTERTTTRATGSADGRGWGVEHTFPASSPTPPCTHAVHAAPTPNRCVWKGKRKGGWRAPQPQRPQGRNLHTRCKHGHNGHGGPRRDGGQGGGAIPHPDLTSGCSTPTHPHTAPAGRGGGRAGGGQRTCAVPRGPAAAVATAAAVKHQRLTRRVLPPFPPASGVAGCARLCPSLESRCQGTGTRPSVAAAAPDGLARRRRVSRPGRFPALMSWFFGSAGAGSASAVFTSGNTTAASASLEKVRTSFDHLVYEGFVKTVEVVLAARLAPRGLAGLGVSESGHKTRVSSCWGGALGVGGGRWPARAPPNARPCPRAHPLSVSCTVPPPAAQLQSPSAVEN